MMRSSSRTKYLIIYYIQAGWEKITILTVSSFFGLPSNLLYTYDKIISYNQLQGGDRKRNLFMEIFFFLPQPAVKVINSMINHSESLTFQAK